MRIEAQQHKGKSCRQLPPSLNTSVKQRKENLPKQQDFQNFPDHVFMLFSTKYILLRLINDVYVIVRMKNIVKHQAFWIAQTKENLMCRFLHLDAGASLSTW